jgi:monovalent cation/hydrogen antiporter
VPQGPGGPQGRIGPQARERRRLTDVTTLFEIIALVTVVVAVSAFARKVRVMAPIMLVAVGLGLSLALRGLDLAGLSVPELPHGQLDPQLVLIGILPPLLYVAALETSVPAFRYNLRPIMILAIGLVLFTAAAVGLVVHAILPGAPLAICIALGAVVAPPDAVAATAVARRIGLPRKLVTILEGESLINDATALVLLRLSVAAAVGSAVDIGHIGMEALRAVGGGMLVGALGALAFGYLHRRVTDPLLVNALSLLAPFVVVLAAENVHASSVVAVVVTGLSLGHRMPTLMSAASRLQMDAFWRMVKFLLEGMVFLLVGLQLTKVVTQLQAPPGVVALATIAVLGTVIVTRFVWMYATYVTRLLTKLHDHPRGLSLRMPTAVAWAGMRGVVTLAAALALPTTLRGDATYPRDLFVWLAFAVIIATLGLQGFTLPMVARWLRIQPDDPKEDALAEAAVQHAASEAARARLEASADGAPPDVVERLRTLSEQRTNVAWERLGSASQETPSQAYVRLRREMLRAEREVFRVARDEGRIADEVLRRAQREMDLEESMLERTGEADLPAHEL